MSHFHICAQCEARYPGDGFLEEVREGEFDCDCRVPKNACPECEPELHAAALKDEEPTL